MEVAKLKFDGNIVGVRYYHNACMFDVGLEALETVIKGFIVKQELDLDNITDEVLLQVKGDIIISEEEITRGVHAEDISEREREIRNLVLRGTVCTRTNVLKIKG